jgi:two-component system, cell cycle sensor histidine kinase and response regulator CckA
LDLSGRRRDGSDFPVEIGLSYMETDEGVFAIAFVSDISQRKLTTEHLLHREKMEAIGRLAGGVAHDFNNMLTAIAGYNRMILEALPPGDPLRRYSEEILNTTDRAVDMTNQLLTLARPHIAKPPVIQINTVIAQAEARLRRLAGSDVQLRLQLGGDVGHITADPRHVEQALVNLAVHARGAMPNGGQLTVETANVYLDETDFDGHMGVTPGEFVMLAVSDNGAGMDAGTRRRIFEPFFTTREKGRGAGLDLATVYGTVKQAGGDIRVDSEPGRGSTFRLYFPRVAEPLSELTSASPETSTPSAGGTILLVEDERAVRELTLKMLQNMGYTVLTAENGEEALRISRSYTGDLPLLLTDVLMPGMGGRQLADALIIERPTIKVLFLSGYAENAVVHQGVVDPGVDFLAKPFSPEGLGKKVREILAR